jgi:hypothetical protein
MVGGKVGDGQPCCCNTPRGFTHQGHVKLGSRYAVAEGLDQGQGKCATAASQIPAPAGYAVIASFPRCFTFGNEPAIASTLVATRDIDPTEYGFIVPDPFGFQGVKQETLRSGLSSLGGLTGTGLRASKVAQVDGSLIYQAQPVVSHYRSHSVSFTVQLNAGAGGLLCFACGGVLLRSNSGWNVDVTFSINQVDEPQNTTAITSQRVNVSYGGVASSIPLGNPQTCEQVTSPDTPLAGFECVPRPVPAVGQCLLYGDFPVPDPADIVVDISAGGGSVNGVPFSWSSTSGGRQLGPAGRGNPSTPWSQLPGSPLDYFDPTFLQDYKIFNARFYSDRACCQSDCNPLP